MTYFLVVMYARILDLITFQHPLMGLIFGLYGPSRSITSPLAFKMPSDTSFPQARSDLVVLGKFSILFRPQSSHKIVRDEACVSTLVIEPSYVCSRIPPVKPTRHLDPARFPLREDTRGDFSEHPANNIGLEDYANGGGCTKERSPIRDLPWERDKQRLNLVLS